MDTQYFEKTYRESDLQQATLAAQRAIEELHQREQSDIGMIQSLTKMRCDEVTEGLTLHEADFQYALRLLQENNPGALALFEKYAGIAKCTGIDFGRHLAFSELVTRIQLLRNYREQLENLPNRHAERSYKFESPRAMTPLIELGWVKRIFILTLQNWATVDSLPGLPSEHDPHIEWFVLTDQGKSVCAGLTKGRKKPRMP